MILICSVLHFKALTPGNFLLKDILERDTAIRVGEITREKK